MTNEPNWEDIFTPAPTPDPDAAAAPSAQSPLREYGATSRRDLREQESRGRGGSRGGSGPRGGSSGGSRPPKKRRLTWLWVLLSIVVLLAGASTVVWFQFESQIRSVLGWEEPNDYVGQGTDEVVVTIQSGDIGEDVARTLHKAGVTKSFDAFYDLLLKQDPAVEFVPGSFSLKKQMSAQAALDALQDPANKITDRVTIPEGTVLPNALVLLSEGTDISLEDFQAAAADYISFGVPAEAPSLEGYLFPATYTIEPGQTAHDVLQMLVTEMFTRLDAAGVAPGDRHRVLTMAALIQREAGSNPDDFYKVSRVFQNRLDQGMLLQSDATVAYGTGNLHTVWTTDPEREDPNNPYNTYVHQGLPVGPIGLPGELAIDAALHPADGPWLYFVPVNLATGETVFSETIEEHDAAVERLHEWCAESAENDAYCE